MKRLQIPMSISKFLVALAVLLLSAGAALYAEFNAGYYSEEKTGLLRQTLPLGLPSGASYDAGAYPLFPPSLPAGAGREEVKAFCNTCHSVRYITMQPPLPPETWAAEVKKMIQTYGASVPDDSTARIIYYLQTNFCPDTRKE